MILKIGDAVRASNILIKRKQWNVEKCRWDSWWQPHPLNMPIKCALYLGTTTLFDGYSSWEGEEVGYAFTQSKPIPAAVIQPIDSGGRYRKPQYVRLEDVEKDDAQETGC